MNLPSRDQPGTIFSWSSATTSCWLRPSESTSVMWLCLPRRESKTIHLPSGDQRGVPAHPLFAKVVSFCGPLPSALLFQISVLPVRSDRNRIWRPSGESCVESSAPPEATSFVSESTLPAGAASSARQVAGGKPEYSTYARRWPSELRAPTLG